jgi:hypothetical protein
MSGSPHGVLGVENAFAAAAPAVVLEGACAPAVIDNAAATAMAPASAPPISTGVNARRNRLRMSASLSNEVR